ncbi:MAG: metallophosphoesterase family protein [Dongiaceae bacterium]
MFWKKKAIEGTTIFFCSDIHASTVCFRKFLNAAKHYNDRGVRIDVLIVGGDITGKLIVPIIRAGPNCHRSYLYGKELTLASPSEIAELVRKTEVLGVYPHIFEPDEYEAFKSNPAGQDKLFKSLALKRLEEWMNIAAEKLHGTEIRCYVSPGNDDFDECVAVIDRSPKVRCPDMKTVEIEGGHEMINLGYANITPFNCPRDRPEAELTERVDRMAAEVRDMPNCVFNLHCPPVGSGLDDAPLLDDELRPTIGTTGVVMAPVGSRAVRQAIEKYQPLLALHGHVHESRGAIKLGRTLCINPGSEYSEGILHGALVTIRKGEVVRHMLTRG